MKTIGQWIIAVVGTNAIMATLTLGIGGCTPDSRWCEHRVIPADRVVEADRYTIQFIEACNFWHTNWEDIKAVEEAVLRLYGQCPYDCKEQGYLLQAQREIALEAALDMIVEDY